MNDEKNRDGLSKEPNCDQKEERAGEGVQEALLSGYANPANILKRIDAGLYATSFTLAKQQLNEASRALNASAANTSALEKEVRLQTAEGVRSLNQSLQALDLAKNSMFTNGIIRAVDDLTRTSNIFKDAELEKVEQLRSNLLNSAEKLVNTDALRAGEVAKATLFSSDFLRILNEFTKTSDALKTVELAKADLFRSRFLEVTQQINRGLLYNPVVSAAAAATIGAIESHGEGIVLHEIRERSFLVDAMVRVHEVEPHAAPQRIENVVLAILEDFTARFRSARTWAEKQGLMAILGLVLAIVGVLISSASLVHDVADSASQDAAIAETNGDLHRIGNTLEKVLDELEVARLSREADQHGRILVASRNANLRAEPSTSAKIVGKLRAGDWGELLESRGGWCRLRVYDPLLGDVKEAWVFGQLVREPPPD